MNRSSDIKRVINLLFVFIVTAALVSADLVVLAQNDATRGATMSQDNSNAATNTNAGTTRRRRRRRARRRSGSAAANMNANVSPDMQGDANANMAGDTGNVNMTADMSNANANMSMRRGGRRRRRSRNMAADTNMAADANANTAATDAQTNMSAMPRRHGRCDNMVQEQTDLSGTYTGNINYPDGGLSGDATLAITGNNFTLTNGSNTINGHVSATTTCNYTAAAMQLGEMATATPGQPAPAPPTVVSVRAKKMGDRLMLMSVSGEKHAFSFGSTGTRGGRRGRRGRGMTMAAPPADTTAAPPAETPAADAAAAASTPAT
ncbi:MAG: hypothetical protein WCB68_01995, partial [Pyrinomonadaceae bacterium]